MTAEHLALLQASIDQVVVLDTAQGEHFLARILFVFDGGETPDTFFVEVEAGLDGGYTEKGSSGHSVLLADILAVRQP